MKKELSGKNPFKFSSFMVAGTINIWELHIYQFKIKRWQDIF